MSYYPKQILDALSHVRYPGTGKDIVSSGLVADNIRIEGNKISFSLHFDKTNDPFAKSLVKASEQAILTYVDANADIKGNISVEYKSAPIPPEKPLNKVKYVIAVSSGKGGVGKSTISANLAISLAKQGYRVGLLDADIYGPSMPKMFGVEKARPVGVEIEGRELIEPIEVKGIKLLSIGFFVDPANAIIWRGAMASNAIKQLINDANWGELDYFVVDLPPGTSDIHLTLVQSLHIDGAIVVTTPQQVALADARKGIQMFQTEKIEVPIIGLIENMAWFTPAELPNNKYYIFGKDGGKQLAEEKQVPLIAQIPLVQSICDSGDSGTPYAVADKSPLSRTFEDLATHVIERLEKIKA